MGSIDIRIVLVSSNPLIINLEGIAMKKQYMGIDQYGQTYHRLNHPRKDLLDRLGYKGAQKIYQDATEGARHVGYVIGGLWISLYEVKGINT
jgi:hypothetical protein